MKQSNLKNISDLLRSETSRQHINFKEFQFQIEVGQIWFSSFITMNFYVLFSLLSLTNKFIWTFKREEFITFTIIFVLNLLIFISSYLPDLLRKIAFRIYLKSCVFIIFYVAETLILFHLRSLPNFSENQSKSAFLMTCGMFFLYLVIYNFYDNYVIKKLKNRILFLENLNEVYYKYTDSLVEKISCLFYTFTDQNLEENFLYLNTSSRDFLDNKIVPNFTRQTFKDSDYDENFRKRILKSKHILI